MALVAIRITIRLSVCLSLPVCWLVVLQKKRMRRKADWGHAGGPLDILKACQEITAGRGGCLSTLNFAYSKLIHDNTRAAPWKSRIGVISQRPPQSTESPAIFLFFLSVSVQCTSGDWNVPRRHWIRNAFIVDGWVRLKRLPGWRDALPGLAPR